MTILYYVEQYDKEGKWPIECEVSREDTEMLWWLAEECAENYHDNHDGWEASWPLTFVLKREDGTLIGRFEVDREARPVFSAHPLD